MGEWVDKQTDYKYTEIPHNIKGAYTVGKN